MTHRPEPKVDDLLPNGAHKYPTWDAYLRDLRAWDREETLRQSRDSSVAAGIGFGSALAMILSFQLNDSIPWAIVHGICSWFYVIYRAWKGNY